jgi:hypothetical protein
MTAFRLQRFCRTFSTLLCQCIFRPDRLADLFGDFTPPL